MNRNTLITCSFAALTLLALSTLDARGQHGTVFYVQRQATTPGTAETGNFNISGTGIAGFFKGNGSQLTNLNASNIRSGLLSHAFLPSNIPRYNLPGTFYGKQTFTAAPDFSPANGSPFTVGNSTVVSGLNADLLDGLDSSVFPQLVSGKLGLGTATPQAQLHIFAGAPNVSGLLNATKFLIDSAGDSFMTFRSPTGTRQGFIFGNPSAFNDGYITYNDDVSRGFGFGTAGPTVRMVINNTGNVGIGTTSPTNGKLQVNGVIAGSIKNFLIDDPTDPANKYLRHSCVESDEMKNYYDGEAVLDDKGESRVELPGYFETLNAKFRYTLTAMDEPMPGLFIKARIKDGKFLIAGGRPGGSICWSVTGVRIDPYAAAHPLRVQELKAENDRGHYLHPEVYGLPDSMEIGAGRGRR